MSIRSQDSAPLPGQGRSPLASPRGAAPLPGQVRSAREPGQDRGSLTSSMSSTSGWTKGPGERSSLKSLRSSNGKRGFTLQVLPEPSPSGPSEVDNSRRSPRPSAGSSSQPLSIKDFAEGRRKNLNPKHSEDFGQRFTGTPSHASGKARMSIKEARSVDTFKSRASRASSLYHMEFVHNSRLAVFLGVIRRRIAPYCRALSKNKAFQTAMFVALLCALFLPDFWILADRPDNSDLDVILTLVLAMFLCELVVQSVGLTRTYWWSFFFWMDLLGAVSLLLDLSYLKIMSAGSDTVSSNAVVMRAARVAKLGARAGRFTRLIKLLRFLPGMREQGTDAGTAKVISGRLITALSTRVSCLIILMVMIMPMFSMWTYPEQDGSIKSWLKVLEDTIERDPGKLQQRLAKFETFYRDMDYYPYSLWAKPGMQLPDAVAQLLPWSSLLPPNRKTNSVRHESSILACDFNFKKPYQIDSLMNVLLLLVVVILMVGFSLVLSGSVSGIVLRPLEKLFHQVREMASTIFHSVTDMACTMWEEAEEGEQEEEEDEDASAAFGNETVLLEKVLQKLSVLSGLTMTMNKSVVDPATLEGLGEDDKAVINGFQGHTGAEAFKYEGDGDKGEEEDSDYEQMLKAQKAMVENAGLSLELLNSWNLNPLELDKARNHAAAMYFCGPHNHGVSFNPDFMSQFIEKAELGYEKSCPYHSWFHAIDVTHCVYRLLLLCSSDEYLSGTERYALLVSAVGHDLGHPGLNNAFLMETSHELALRYNDKSPLENMHCSKLFELVGLPECNIFSTLPRSQYQDVRKVCIDAILNTDNAQHFSMIKEIQVLYEVNSEVMDAQREFYCQDPGNFPTKEVTNCFREPESRKLLVKFVLHLADISNSMKPFRICRIWAFQVLEEFFSQGDAEKRMGVPVQALNDREKVNRPFSQIGFIEFLVSPLLFAVVKVLPPLEPLLGQTVQNVRTWHQQWLKTPKSDTEQASLSERVKRLEMKYTESQKPGHR